MKNQLYNIGPSMMAGICMEKEFAKKHSIISEDNTMCIEKFEEFLKKHYFNYYYEITHSFASWTGSCFDSEKNNLYIIIAQGIICEKQFTLIKEFCENRISLEENETISILLEMHKKTCEKVLSEIEIYQNTPWYNGEDVSGAVNGRNFYVDLFEKTKDETKTDSDALNELLDAVISAFDND